MRWMASWTGLALGVACFSGCKATPKSANEEAPAGQAAMLEPVDAPEPDPAPAEETIVDNPAPFDAPPVSQAEPLPKWQYAPANPHQARVHVVEPKETLYAIARRYYNDEKQWRKILEANRNRIRDPNKIEIGMKLIIP